MLLSYWQRLRYSVGNNIKKEYHEENSIYGLSRSWVSWISKEKSVSFTIFFSFSATARYRVIGKIEVKKTRKIVIGTKKDT